MQQKQRMFHDSVFNKLSVKCNKMFFVFWGCKSIYNDYITKYPRVLVVKDLSNCHLCYHVPSLTPFMTLARRVSPVTTKQTFCPLPPTVSDGVVTLSAHALRVFVNPVRRVSHIISRDYEKLYFVLTFFGQRYLT